MKLLNKNPILGLANSYLIDSPQPVNLSYNWNYGSLLGICLIVQIVTGVLLAMHYQPSWDGAFDSVEAIMRDLNHGWLLRYTHANGATFFFIFVYLHMGRGLYYGSYRSPRSAVWLIGVALFLVLIITAFLGYVIVLGSMSYWGAAVITNLVSVIPWIGPKVVEFIWGGFSVNEATINRFFALHYLMPFILSALVAMHLLTLHTSGSTNPAQISANSDRIPFSPFFVVKDGVTVLLYIMALLAFVYYLPNYFGEVINYDKADPMKTPLAIVPEWYLLSFYAILRSIPNKLAGVVAMAAAILILAALPLLDRAQVKGSQVKPLGQVLFWGFVANFAVLTWIGSCHPEAGFIEVGQVATVIYFAYFLVLIPLCSALENWNIQTAARTA